MGWIVAALMTMVTCIALGLLWRRHQREIRNLRSAHKSTVRELGDEHRRRIQRLDREHDQQLDAAHHPLARDLFPALDSLDKAIDHIDNSQPQSVDDLLSGLNLARTSLDTALSRHGIVPIAPEPESPFDPEIHEAIARNETDTGKPNTISRLFRRGYRHGKRVLRPALVEVIVDPTQSAEPSVDEPEDSDDLEADGDSSTVPDSPSPSPSAGRSDSSNGSVEPNG